MSLFEARFERLELKYLIDEFTADRIRRDIEPYCYADPHNANTGRDRGPVQEVASVHSSDQGASVSGPGYDISSLYLDSPGLEMFYAKERGDSERMKLRVRTYQGSEFAVLELKRKVSDVISKTRASVPRAEVQRIARGLLPAASDPEIDHFLNDFAMTTLRVGAQPKLHVRYNREAYLSNVDTYARVTMDRRVQVQRTDSWSLEPNPKGWCAFDPHRRPELRGNSVILELKCQSIVPSWINNLVRTHALKRRSFSKYGIGIYLTAKLNWDTSLPDRSAKAFL